MTAEYNCLSKRDELNGCVKGAATGRLHFIATKSEATVRSCAAAAGRRARNRDQAGATQRVDELCQDL
jgi:hypothetical protein